MPLIRFVDGEVDVCQSNAILRYIGRKWDLMGASEKQACMADVAMEGVESLRSKYLVLIYQNNLVSCVGSLWPVILGAGDLLIGGRVTSLGGGLVAGKGSLRKVRGKRARWPIISSKWQAAFEFSVRGCM